MAPDRVPGDLQAPTIEGQVTETAGATDDPRLHVRVAEDLRKKIAAGVLAAGDAVSITYTSQEWGISRQTVSKALGTLERDGAA
jgi:DNA-binding GntR family transcriptional regulator